MLVYICEDGLLIVVDFVEPSADDMQWAVNVSKEYKHERRTIS